VKRGGATVMEIDLVHATSDELDLVVRGDQLHVRVRDARRRITLPDSVAGRAIESAKLESGVLKVVFEG
jgi:HSP20 family molecular chaperone IbpA